MLSQMKDTFVRAFEINKDIINCDFHIIVWSIDKENTAITNLKQPHYRI